MSGYPICGHSACRQNYIDTGSGACVQVTRPEQQSGGQVRNPFRSADMRHAFDECVRMYRDQHKNLFRADGVTPHRGNGIAMMFWRGYEGTMIGGQWDAASKRLVSYAYWKAGEAVRDANAKVTQPDPLGVCRFPARADIRDGGVL